MREEKTVRVWALGTDAIKDIARQVNLQIGMGWSVARMTDANNGRELVISFWREVSDPTPPPLPDSGAPRESLEESLERHLPRG